MQNKPNIYEYLDYRSFLKDLYLFKKKTSATFSFRAFSLAAGLKSSNFLKLVMDGKRNLSSEAIHKFAKAFKLNRGETHFFETLVLFNQAKNNDEKNLYYERLAQSKSYHDIKPIEAYQYAYFSNWYFVALRELVLLSDFKEDPVWINKKLKIKIHPDEIKRAIRILLELKLLERDSKGRLKQTIEKITTTPEMGTLAIVNYHREMLKKASASIEGTPAGQRDVSALTLALSKKHYERIRHRLNEFRREIHAIASEAGEREAVYQMNFQLFNLSEVAWK